MFGSQLAVAGVKQEGNCAPEHEGGTNDAIDNSSLMQAHKPCSSIMDLLGNKTAHKWATPVIGAFTISLTAYLILELPNSIPQTVRHHIQAPLWWHPTCEAGHHTSYSTPVTHTHGFDVNIEDEPSMSHTATTHSLKTSLPRHLPSSHFCYRPGPQGRAH